MRNPEARAAPQGPSQPAEHRRHVGARIKTHECASHLQEGARPGVVVGALVHLEPHRDLDHGNRREVLADEIGVPHLEDHRTDEVCEACGCLRSGIGRSRREPKPRDCRRRLDRLDARPAAEVMDLVHNQQPEAISELVHVPVGALERHDGDSLHRSMTVAYEADRLPREVSLELLYPCDGERLGWTQNRRR